MYSKFSNIVLTLVIVFSFAVMNNANAGLILNNIYTDSTNVQWQYIDSFDLTGYINSSNTTTVVAPWWRLSSSQYGSSTSVSKSIDYGFLPSDGNYYAHPLNGIDTAIRLFGAGDYALSTVKWNTNNAYVVNHKAWYDTYQGSTINALSESLNADNNGNNIYNTSGDRSAFIQDRNVFNDPKFLGGYGAHINYVFKKVAVPEPSTLAIFILALMALSTRRLKHK